MHGSWLVEIWGSFTFTLRWAWNQAALGWVKTRGWITIVRGRFRVAAHLVFTDGLHVISLWQGMIAITSISARIFLVRGTVLRVLRVNRLRGIAGYYPGRLICVSVHCRGRAKKLCRAWGRILGQMLWSITSVCDRAVVIALVGSLALRAVWARTSER